MKPRPNRNISPSTVLLMRQIIIGLMIAAFFGMLIISVWYATRVDALTITEVRVSGGETIPHEDVEAIVRSKLGGSYLGIVPRAFAFTYPHDDIESGVRDIKRIKHLQIVRSGGTVLSVEFDEYVPHSLWCKESESNGCFFLDDTGYSFSPAPSLSGGAFLRFVSIGKDPSEHTQGFKEDEYKKVHELVGLLSEMKWYVSKVEIDMAGDAFFAIVGGGEFKISLKQSAKETVDNLSTVLNSDKFSHIKAGAFEYIDLRFGEKVFVNEVTIDTGSASSTDIFAPASTTSATPPAESTPPEATTPEPEVEVPPVTIPDIIINTDPTEEG